MPRKVVTCCVLVFPFVLQLWLYTTRYPPPAKVLAHIATHCPDIDLTAAHTATTTTTASLLDTVFREKSAIYKKVQAGVCNALAVGLLDNTQQQEWAEGLHATDKDVRAATAGVHTSNLAQQQARLEAALAPVGAAALAPEVGAWVGGVRLVVQLTWALCGPYYEAIWAARQVLTNEE